MLYAVVVSLHKWGLGCMWKQTHTRRQEAMAKMQLTQKLVFLASVRGGSLIVGTSWYSGRNLRAPKVSLAACCGWQPEDYHHVPVNVFAGSDCMFLPRRICRVCRIPNPKSVLLALRHMWVSFGSFLLVLRLLLIRFYVFIFVLH